MSIFSSVLDGNLTSLIASASDMDPVCKFPTKVLQNLLGYCTEPCQFFLLYFLNMDIRYFVGNNPQWNLHIEFKLLDPKLLPKQVLNYVSNLSIHEKSRGKLNNGHIKKILKTFPSLRILNLNECPQITEKFIKGLDGLSVSELHLSSCKKITNKAIEEIRNYLPFLKKLSLSRNQKIDDGGIEFLPEYLTHLEICDNRNLTDNGFQKLNPMISLNVSGCKKLTGDCIKLFGGVKELDVSGCSAMSDQELKSLRGGLSVLKAGGYRCDIIGDKGLKYIGSTLRVLDISSNKVVTDHGLHYLEGQKLEEININGCTKITNKGLRRIKSAKKVWVQNNQNITDEGMQYLKKFHTVDISYCGKITDAGMDSLSHVYCLTIRSNKNLTKSGIKKLTHVEVLSVSECPKLGNKAMACISDSVRSVDVSGCVRIGDEGLRFLELCDELNLSKLDKITDVGLKFLDRSLEVDVSYCKRISDRGIKYLKYVEKLTIGENGSRGMFQRGLNSLKRVWLVKVVGVRKCVDPEILRMMKLRGVKFKQIGGT